MKLFSVSIGLLLATLGIFFVPISFAVDGFGLVVNPGGVRTIKAVENGVVLHFPNEGGRFHPGEFVTAVYFPEAVAKNALLEGTLLKDLAKIEADHIEKTSKNALELERERAKRDATAERLAAREELTSNTAGVVDALQSFNAESGTDIDALNAVLQEVSCSDQLIVDGSRWSESHWGWVHLNVFPQGEFSQFEGFASLNGVLTWPVA